MATSLPLGPCVSEAKPCRHEKSADLSTELRTDVRPKFTGSESLCCRYNVMVLAHHVVIITSVQRHSIRHNDVATAAAAAAAVVIVVLSARARCDLSTFSRQPRPQNCY